MQLQNVFPFINFATGINKKVNWAGRIARRENKNKSYLEVTNPTKAKINVHCT